MAIASRSKFLLHILLLLSTATTAFSTLSPHYYHKICPKALPTIKRVVKDAVKKESRMGASLLRLHFHDCFVQGCDGSILLDSTPCMDSEKNAGGNKDSVRGFKVVDLIKKKVDKVCRRSVVSCADILAVAARDSVVALGGPTWKVQLGRRDSTTASMPLANKNLPSPSDDLPALIKKFKRQGLNESDLVALSGAHTLGFAQCSAFRDRIYSGVNIDSVFANARRKTCPLACNDSSLAPLDGTAVAFDTRYFTNLLKRRGLFQSDQALFTNGSTGELVKTYSYNFNAFSNDFANSMIKMGNTEVLTGKQGQIRLNCRRVN